MVKSQTAPLFDGFRAIDRHAEQRSRFENFITGQSEEQPDLGLTSCNADCLCAQWLHTSVHKDAGSIRLIKQVCGACEVFQSMASQAVSLANIGKTELAKEILKEGGTYAAASAEFQRKLVLLHSTIIN
ncbi:MAG TPA: hypothetical protein VGD24_03350 [Gallionella sp.]